MSASNDGARYQNDIICWSIVFECPCDQSALPLCVARTAIMVIFPILYFSQVDLLCRQVALERFPN